MRFPVLRTAILLSALAVPLAAQTVVEEIVARVNDGIITRSDLTHGRDTLEQEMKGKPAAEFATREKDLLRDLIDSKLLVQKAKDVGISVDNDLIKRLDDLRKQNNFSTMEELEKAAKDQGISFEDFKESMRNSMLTQKVISQEVGRRITITPSEIHAYYEAHKADFVEPEQARLGEILISTEPKPNGAALTMEAAEAKAKSLLEQIRGGATFEELAKKDSDDSSSASKGGDLGFWKKGELGDELDKVVFALKPGQVSEPIVTKQGVILLKMLEHKDAGAMSEKDADMAVQEKIYYEKLAPATREYLTQLREDAYIDIKQGYVDTGASPNETKPVIAEAVTDPGEQPKKKKKKLGIF